jgi:rhodanese-related sulfurtransferase
MSRPCPPGSFPSATSVAAATLPAGRIIVVHGSIGLRSAALARQPEGLGFRNVYHLKDSIFQWQKQGLPLVASGVR